MSALARLVARATGQSAPGLTPRLPARFETAPDEIGMTEPRVPAPGPVATAEAPDSPPRPATLAARAPDPGLQRAFPDGPELVAVAPSENSRPPSTTVLPSPPAPLVRETAPISSPLHRAALPPSPPLVAAVTPQPALPAGQAPPSVTLGSPALGAPPEPLFPPLSPRAMPAPQPASAPDRPTAQAMTRPAAAPPAPQPPEITVHIGRLHVVTEARVPRAPPDRPAKRADTLSDYLRGKGGAA